MLAPGKELRKKIIVTFLESKGHMHREKSDY